EERDERRGRDADGVPRAAEVRAALVTVEPAVAEPLLDERGRARRAALVDDDVRRVPERHRLPAQPTVEDVLPEAVSILVPRPLEERPLVRRVVAGDVVALARRERAHLARIAAEVLRPVGERESLARIDRAPDHVVRRVLLLDLREPVGR